MTFPGQGILCPIHTTDIRAFVFCVHHTGAPMGCAPMAHVLWGHFMKYNPQNPKWVSSLWQHKMRSIFSSPLHYHATMQFNRDRFVLSNGHACALQYIMLHLTGYDLSMDQLKKFRKLGSMYVHTYLLACLSQLVMYRYTLSFCDNAARLATLKMSCMMRLRYLRALSDKEYPTLWAWLWPNSIWQPNSTLMT